MSITVSVEGERGCGYRQEGGLYLMGGTVFDACNKLPIPLDICPTCNGGIKFSRGWTWIDANPIVKPGAHSSEAHDSGCPMGMTRVSTEEYVEWIPRDLSSSGLLWVGERSYSPQSYIEEAVAMGVSKRINFIPRKLKVGESVIFLAHKKVEPVGPAIFTAFIPNRIEYVVKGDETDEDIAKLEKRGIIPVKVERE